MATAPRSERRWICIAIVVELFVAYCSLGTTVSTFDTQLWSRISRDSEAQPIQLHYFYEERAPCFQENGCLPDRRHEYCGPGLVYGLFLLSDHCSQSPLCSKAMVPERRLHFAIPY